MSAPVQHPRRRTPWRGRLVKEVMREQGVSQERLALWIGTQQAHVSKYLSGYLRASEHFWQRAAAELGIDPTDIESEEAAADAYLKMSIERLLGDEADDDPIHEVARLLADRL